MTQFITLTKDEAEKLRSITSPGHALDPIELEDGVTFILPLEVLADPAHAKFLGDRKSDAVKPVDIRDTRKKRVVLPGEFKKVPLEIDPKAADPKAAEPVKPK